MATIANDIKPSLRVLLVEDSEQDARLILRELTRGGFAVVYQCVDDADSLKQALRTKLWDIVLSDYVMPHFSGADALLTIREYGMEMPFIFVSGSMGEEFAVEAMKVGAHDYITKDNLKRLVPAIHYSLRQAIKENQRREAEAKLQYLAHFDLLTKLPNRTLFNERLDQILNDARSQSSIIGVAYLDLNRFKSINDALGHEVGDILLQSIARRLRVRLRDLDTVARPCSDEFAFIFTEIPNQEEADNIAHKVLGAFSAPFVIAENEISIDAALGLALYPTDGEDRANLMRNANAAMYQAKKLGGNQYQFSTADTNANAVLRLEFESALAPAIKNDEFILHFQALVDVTTAMIVGAETLVRWQHPKHGLIEPDKFIPLSEESGIIVPLGTWVFRNACIQARNWELDGVKNIRLAVNFSVLQFRQGRFIDLVNEILTETEANPAFLEIEITESVFMHDSQAILKIFRHFRNLGIRVCLDGFGTGYLSLSYLKRLPLNSIKIDRSFVQEIPDDPENTAIISAIIAMAQKLGIEVAAEGVESKAQVDFLKQEGCRLMQGYYLSRPATAEQIKPQLLSGKIELR